MASIQRRGRAIAGFSNQRPALSIFIALNLAAWLAYILLSVSDGRTLNFEDSVPLSIDQSSSPTIPSNQQELNSLERRLKERGVPPVSCSKVLRDARNDAISLDPNQGKLYARYTSEEPHFYISVHNLEYDKVRFKVFETDGFYYERVLTECFRQVLSPVSSDSTIISRRVLDVGGNIGWYALLSAALGAEVASFEPHEPNYLRMCESMCLNHWLHSDSGESHCLMGSSPLVQERIHIFPYGVSDKNELLHFYADKNNPGQSRVMKRRSNSTIPVRVVTLDDMVESLGWASGEIDILKVDVEGAELQVFTGSTKLLRSRRVQNIFMEGNVRSLPETMEFETLIQLILDSGGYYLHKIGGFSGPESAVDVPVMNKDFTKNLVKECGNNPARQCNLWWKTKKLINNAH